MMTKSNLNQPGTLVDVAFELFQRLVLPNSIKIKVRYLFVKIN